MEMLEKIDDWKCREEVPVTRAVIEAAGQCEG